MPNFVTISVYDPPATVVDGTASIKVAITTAFMVHLLEFFASCHSPLSSNTHLVKWKICAAVLNGMSMKEWLSRGGRCKHGQDARTTAARLTNCAVLT
jgi:hypothetical protein